MRTILLVIALALSVPAGAFANCGRAADRDPAAPGVSERAARAATLCLLNAERRQRHLHGLRFNGKLGLAAVRHARDMVQHRYFSHRGRNGQTFVQRIMSTDYVPFAARWFLGENLAWGDRQKSTPRSITRAWMRSPDHRRNILASGFREIGIAIVAGAPVDGVTQAATYATEFGAVRRL